MIFITLLSYTLRFLEPPNSNHNILHYVQYVQCGDNYQFLFHVLIAGMKIESIFARNANVAVANQQPFSVSAVFVAFCRLKFISISDIANKLSLASVSLNVVRLHLPSLLELEISKFVLVGNMNQRHIYYSLMFPLFVYQGKFVHVQYFFLTSDCRFYILLFNVACLL